MMAAPNIFFSFLYFLLFSRVLFHPLTVVLYNEMGAGPYLCQLWQLSICPAHIGHIGKYCQLLSFLLKTQLSCTWLRQKDVNFRTWYDMIKKKTKSGFVYYHKFQNMAESPEHLYKQKTTPSSMKEKWAHLIFVKRFCPV